MLVKGETSTYLVTRSGRSEVFCVKVKETWKKDPHRPEELGVFLLRTLDWLLIHLQKGQRPRPSHTLSPVFSRVHRTYDW